MEKNMRAGYQGKYDSMRALADKLTKHSGHAKDVYYSKSCADKEPMRPFKEGGRVDADHRDEKHMNKRHHDETATEIEFKKGGAVNKRTVKREKFAAGGVAKIRHDQSTPDGKQLGTKR